MKRIDLRKKQELDANPKIIQQINFTRNLSWGEDVNENRTMFFIIKWVKETTLDFSQGTVKVLWMCSKIILL